MIDKSYRNMVLRSADELAVHRDHEASVIVLEYGGWSEY